MIQNYTSRWGRVNVNDPKCEVMEMDAREKGSIIQ